MDQTQTNATAHPETNPKTQADYTTTNTKTYPKANDKVDNHDNKSTPDNISASPIGQRRNKPSSCQKPQRELQR
ncbi:unnamed protein product [Clavelina lepadiformis]|uniref:Uncharacterized protein n=1 Tax=Clavelina lepadiformis TaxID=159417 RepID=A0ABP0GQJ8_CLALP